ncbi:DMT family transporter [Metabacillus idriensis]|uniref:DMT family transporter n=1 Tax=Metabacillus idriensis TaxID=324768 RepID=UPI003D2B57F0
MKLKKSSAADLSLLLVALIWGSTFVIVQKAIQFMPPHFFNGVRFLAAAGILTMISLRMTRFRLSKETLFAGISLGIFLFLGYAFQTVGLLYTTSSKAGFITGLSVMIVPLLSSFLLRERARKTVYFAAALGTAGLYLLTLSDFSSFNIGDLLVFFCAGAFAFHIIFTGKFSGSHDAWMLTIAQLVTVSFLSFLSSGIFEASNVKKNFSSMFTFEVLFALIITALFATAFAFFVQTKLQQYTTASRVAIIYSSEPVFAALTAFLFIGERLTVYGMTGCLLILAAMLTAEWNHDKTKESLST